MKKPLLSVCLCGRNDGYGFDFTRRFAQAMNFLAFSAAKIGALDEIEVVFADWNCEKPMADAVRLSDDAARMVKFVEIPPSFAKPRNFGKTPFHSTHSLNIAFRRASGAFVAMMPGDILVAPPALQALLKLISGASQLPFNPERCVLCVPRRKLPFYFNDAKTFSSCQAIERILLLGDRFVDDSPLKGVGGNYGMLAASREMVDLAGGFDELFGGWGGSDDAIALKINRFGPVVNLAGLGIFCFDFEPTKKMTGQKDERLNALLSLLDKPRLNPDWGFPSEKFPERFAKPAPEIAKPAGKLDLQAALSPDSRRRALFMKRFLRLKWPPFASSMSFAIAGMAEQLAPKRFVALGWDGDLSTLAALSFAAPCAEIVLTDEWGRLSKDVLSAGALLQDCGHVAQTNYIPSLEALLEEETRKSFGIEAGGIDMIAVLNQDGLALFVRLLEKKPDVFAPGCAFAFKAGLLESGSVDQDSLARIFPEKAVLEARAAGLVLCANVEGVSGRIAVEPRAASAAWAPERGNLLSSLAMKLASAEPGKLVKALRAVFRQSLVENIKNAKRLAKL